MSATHEPAVLPLGRLKEGSRDIGTVVGKSLDVAAQPDRITTAEKRGKIGRSIVPDIR